MKPTKLLSEAINKSLDELHAPTNSKERASVLSKMLDIPRQQAWSLLEGHTFPNQELLQRLSEELEIDLSFLKNA